MKPLYLDIGNSFVKLAERNGDDWQILFDGKINRFDELVKFLDSKKIDQKIILSSVRKDISKKLKSSLTERFIVERSTSDIPPKMIDYKTTETLGLDRFLVCLAAWKESNNEDVIVVDAGSACTVDLMTKEGVFIGGIIMPGLQIIKHSMKNRLPELPEAPDSIPQEWPGKSTIECIGWGVNGGFLMAIQGFIDQYRTITENPKIYITGGNARQILNWMGDRESLKSRKNLIWNGMEEFEKLIQS
ncbi:MAG: type III pantothenate kinase [Balneolaceae bacterium]|nr:type III pantothenate kinase [Balneolaceae bacterium]